MMFGFTTMDVLSNFRVYLHKKNIDVFYIFIDSFSAFSVFCCAEINKFIFVKHIIHIISSTNDNYWQSTDRD